MGRANTLLSSPAPPVWEAPSLLPHLFSPWPPSYDPKDPCDMEGTLESRGSAWELSRLPEPEWAGQSPSAPLLLLPEGPSHLPLLISPASLLCLQDPCSLDGALEGGYWLGSSAGSPAQVGQVITLHSSPALPGESVPPHPRLPLLISPASGAPILSGLHSSTPSVPLHPTSSLWGSSRLLGHQSPRPAASRHPSCGETLTPCLPTPPS